MGLINSRTGAARVTLEERRRRDQEIALEEGEPNIPLCCSIVCSQLLCTIEYARGAHQQREEEDLEFERELSRWAYHVCV